MTDRFDRVFKALGHQVRRQILDDLRDQPLTTGTLVAHFPELDRCTVMQHLKVLEDCGLIRSRTKGRVRTCELRPKPLTDAEHWLSNQRALWTKRLDQLDAFLDTLKTKDTRS